jgi:DNA polymerase-1
MPETVYLVDGTSQIYRAFYAIKGLSTSSGLPTNAIYGFTQMLLKLLQDRRPKYLGMAFDTKGEVFREKLYDQYKANRPPMPDTLKPQIPYIKEIVKGFAVPVLEREGFEADDVMATLAVRSAAEGRDVLIITRDKDMMQIVGDKIALFDPFENRVTDRQGVIQKLGVAPEQVPDFLGLAGDAVDNIPGVPGIGPKTAAKLLQEHASLDGILETVEGWPESGVRSKILENREKALQSRELARLRTDLDLGIGTEGLAVGKWSLADLKRIFGELEFRKLAAQVEGPLGLFQ